MPVKKVCDPHGADTTLDANRGKATGGVILLTDTKPSEPKTLLELKVKKAVAAPTTEAAGPSGAQAATSGQGGGSGEAVDETTVDEGTEDAEAPDDFEYMSFNEDGDEED